MKKEAKVGVSYWQLTGSISGTVTLDDGAIRYVDSSAAQLLGIYFIKLKINFNKHVDAWLVFVIIIILIII